MITDTEGIVLRQTKAAGGRRMLTIFSKKYGKISVGTGLTEGGKNKTALAIKPFTYGKYELFKSRDNYNLNSGQVLKSYFGIGENLDKYMAASYVLELTDKLLPEEMPQPKLFNLLTEFMEALSTRDKKQGTLILAYMVKTLDILGTMPELDVCTCCGNKNSVSTGNKLLFSIQEGGFICSECAGQHAKNNEQPLIYKLDFGIIDILKYFQKQPVQAFEKIALEDDKQRELAGLMKEYISYHMDVRGLKSESFFQL